MAKPRQVNVYVTSLTYDLDGSLEEVIETLRSNVEMIPDEYRTTAYFSWENNDWDDGKSLKLYYKRPETVKEKTKRIAEETRFLENQERYKREQYERLKKEFEGK